MPTGPVYDGTSLAATALAGALTLTLTGLVRLGGFLGVWFVGWLLADLVAGALGRLLRAVRFDELAERAGLAAFARQAGLDQTASGLLACAVCWLLRLVALVAALGVLGLPTAALALERLALWMPSLLAALAVLVLGGLAATALDRSLQAAAARAGIARPPLLGAMAGGAAWALTLAVALTQLGVAPALLETAFAGVVAALALGFSLAFGLGAQDTARTLIGNWYRQVRRPGVRPASPRLPPSPSWGSTIGQAQPLAAPRRRVVVSPGQPTAPRAPVG
jgi:hypothetical protein